MTTESNAMNSSIVVLKTGEKLITKLQEAYEGEGDDKKGICLVMNYPYELSIFTPSSKKKADEELQVKFSKWCPYSVDVQFRIPYDGILAIGKPDPGLAQAYEMKVQAAQEFQNNTEEE